MTDSRKEPQLRGQGQESMDDIAKRRKELIEGVGAAAKGMQSGLDTQIRGAQAVMHEISQETTTIGVIQRLQENLGVVQTSSADLEGKSIDDLNEIKDELTQKLQAKTADAILVLQQQVGGSLSPREDLMNKTLTELMKLKESWKRRANYDSSQDNSFGV